MEIQAETADELSLDDRVANAYAEFRCAFGPGEKAVKWRSLATLIRKRNEQTSSEHEIEDSA